MLITAIENLTSRALQETGKQWDEMDTNILQSMDTDVHINTAPVHNSKYILGSEHEFQYNTDKCLKSNNMSHSYGSSESSTNSFVPESSENRKDNSMVVRTAELSVSKTNYDRNYISAKKEINNPVITNISYTNNHIKSENQQIIDNNAKETLDCNTRRSSNSNNNSNTEIDS